MASTFETLPAIKIERGYVLQKPQLNLAELSVDFSLCSRSSQQTSNKKKLQQATLKTMMEPQSEPLERLLKNLRQMQNEALSTERFADASDLQAPIMAVLEQRQMVLDCRWRLLQPPERMATQRQNLSSSLQKDAGQS